MAARGAGWLATVAGGCPGDSPVDAAEIPAVEVIALVQNYRPAATAIRRVCNFTALAILKRGAESRPPYIRCRL